MYLVVDRTNSMAGDFNEIRSGIDQYLTTKTDLTAGLSFAPLKSGSATCSGAGYDPPEVPFGPQPASKSTIINALQGLNTAGMPRLEAVLTGGAAALKTLSPMGDKQPVLVVFTDWQPFMDGCSPTTSGLKAAAAAALSNPPHTVTWIIDMGGQSSVLNEIAKSGGSQKAIDNANDPKEIRDALFEASPGCRFAAPANSAGGELTLTETSPASQPLSQVANFAACGSNSNHWFMFNDTLVLCPRTCTDQPPSATYKIDVVCSN